MVKVYTVEKDFPLDFLTDVERVDNVKSADVIIFSGYGDVTPSFYQSKKEGDTRNNYKLDVSERKLYKTIPSDKFLIGIGKGSQFLAVMNGAKINQKAKYYDDNHSTIPIVTFNGLYIEVYNKSYQFIDHQTLPESSDILASRGASPEIIHIYRQDCPRCVCINSHPELIPKATSSKYINELIHKLWL